MDGRTATSLRSGSGGRVEIDIAAPNNGVSVNSFARFNVPDTGVAFDNITKGASAIVADVTGAETSSFNGTLEVTGARADVIIANPNGFTLNGARFQNMRGLALVAGRRRSDTLTYDISPTDGSIAINGGGVVADVRRMDLIARQIRIDGVVGESGGSPFLRVNAAAGTGAATFDPAVVSVDADGYRTLSGRGLHDGDAFSLTLSQGAMVSGGKLTLTADGRGAGVVMAGEGLATAGDFTMTADGRITLDGAVVRGLTNVNITGADITARNVSIASDLEDTTIAASSGLALTDTDITGGNVALDAGGAMLVVGGMVEAQQNLDVTGRSLALSTVAATQMATLRAQQDATLSFGEDLVNRTGLVQAYGNLDITVGGTLHNFLVRDAQNEPLAGFNLATLQADGTLTIDAQTLLNEGGLIRGGGHVELRGDSVTNALLKLGSVAKHKSCFLFLCRSYTSGAFRFSGGGIESDGTLSVDLSGEFRNIGGTLSAPSGLTLHAGSIDFQPLQYDSWYTLPKGPGTLFFGQRTRRFATYETGKLYTTSIGLSVIARNGLLRFTGTEVLPNDLLETLEGADIVAVPADVAKANGKGFGLFSGVLN